MPLRPAERRDSENVFVRFNADRFHLLYTGDYTIRIPPQLGDAHENKSADVISRDFALPPVQTLDTCWDDALQAAQIDFVLDCESLVMVMTAQGVLETNENTVSPQLSRALQQVYERTMEGRMISKAGYLEMFR